MRQQHSECLMIVPYVACYVVGKTTSGNLARAAAPRGLPKVFPHGLWFPAQPQLLVYTEQACVTGVNDADHDSVPEGLHMYDPRTCSCIVYIT